MSTITDSMFNALGVLGHTGTISDRQLSYLHANGATSPHIGDAWLEFLSANGATAPQFNDAMFEFLSVYPGSLPDKKLAWCEAGMPLVPA